MKKITEKLLAILIVAVMMLQTGISAFAAGTAAAAEQPKAVGSVMDDLYDKSEDYLKNFASKKIKESIGKIPVVGNIAKSLFGSYVDKLLGIKKEESVNSMLTRVLDQLDNILNTVNSGTQSVLEKIYEQDLNKYQTLITAVENQTEIYLNTVNEYTASTTLTEEQKTKKISDLSQKAEFDTYCSNIAVLSKFATGETLSVHPDGGIYEKAFNVYCYDAWNKDKFAFGGEAAMLSANYVNAFNTIIDSAQTAAAVILLARCDIEAGKVLNDTVANPDDSEFVYYRNKYDNIRYLHYDIFGVTKEDYEKEVEYAKSRSMTCKVKVKPGVAAAYNEMIADRWFDVINNVNFDSQTPEVSFYELDGEIGFSTLTDGYGYDKKYAASLGEGGIETYCKQITTRVLADKRAAVNDEWLDKLLKHVNSSSVFKDGKKAVSLKDALAGFGFSFAEYDAFTEEQKKKEEAGETVENIDVMFVTNAKYDRDHYVPPYQVAVTTIDGYVYGIDCTTSTADIKGTSSGKKHQYFHGRYDSSKTTDTDYPDVGMLYFRNTIEINSADEFTDFLENIAKGNNYAGKRIALNCDIKLGLDTYKDLWNDNNRKKEFCGMFNGRGHTISDLTLTDSEHRLGLFRTTGDSAEIKNLNLENIKIENKTKSEACAALVGYANGNLTVENVTVKSNCSITGYKYVGGIVGETKEGKHIKVTLINCNNEAPIVSENVDAGGLIGNAAEVDVRKCVNSAVVTAKNGAAGGIVGYIGNCDNDPPVKALNCKNSGVITGYDCAGGIIGHLDSDAGGVEISENINSADVTVTAKRSAGGIVGRNCSVSTFSNNINSGNILNKSTNSDAEAGGILGENEDDAITMTGNKNFGDVTADKRAGGIAGTLGDRDHDKVCTITDNANSGKITSKAKDAGGIIGAVATDNASHKITGNTNTGTVYGQSEVGGIVGWMAGGGLFEANINRASVTSVNLNAGGIAGCVQDDKCEFKKSTVDGKAVVGSASADGIVINAKNTEKHAAKICGWDGKRKASVNSDTLLATIFGQGNIVVIIILAVLLIAAAVIIVLVYKKKKKGAAAA